jgi:crotonobetainyl-CoA:carnitine CoA-transferase CaiB-like acyl-CoA transferase
VNKIGMIKMLQGLKVLDLTTVVLGPFLTQILGDFGAEVIKVESLQGDIYRGVHPQKNKNMGAGFLNCNRNKKSIAIDIKKKEGLKIIKKLIASSDVFVHNMRLSSIHRLGLSYKEVSEINPTIIYCSATGFSSSGLYKDKPAYDDIIQSISGFADLSKDDIGNPKFVPSIITDKISGLYALNGILSALYHKNQTGKGVQLEVPMYESMVSFLLTEHLQGHIYDPPQGDLGYKRILSDYRKPHKTSDGYITIMPYSYENWKQFLQLIGRNDMVESTWLKNATERSRRVDELYKIIDDATPEYSTAYWISELEKRDIPCSKVQALKDLINDPHLQEVSFFKTISHPTEGNLTIPNQPVKINGDYISEYKPVPCLGEQTFEILENLQYSNAEIRELEKNNIVKSF